MPTRGDRHLRAVQQAKKLTALGARLKTIHLITGIPPRQIQSLFFPDVLSIPRGRAPDSADWYYGANLIMRIDACVIGAKYQQLRDQGLIPGEALILAYRAYQATTLPPFRISLDRAFNLVSYIEGIWLASTSALSILSCQDCACKFIAAVGTVAQRGQPCPFCKLFERFHVDHRIQASYPIRTTLQTTASHLRRLGPSHHPSVESERDIP